MMMTVSVVCRRFNRLLTPLLYCNISIKAWKGRSSTDDTEYLHRTLTENPSLREHTQKLDICLTTHSDDDLTRLSVLRNMATFFANAKSLRLTLSLDGSPDDIAVLRAVGGHMIKLRKLEIFAGLSGQSHPPLGHV